MEEREFSCKAIRTDLMIDLVKFREEEPELFEELAKDYPADGTKYFIAVGE